MLEALERGIHGYFPFSERQPRRLTRDRQVRRTSYEGDYFDDWLNDEIDEMIDYFLLFEEEEQDYSGGAPPTLPRVTDVKFVNSGRTHRDNCCAFCPQNLGVGRNGTGQNGMEIQFTLSSHRPGIWYDILRTRRTSLWEQRAGAWHRVETQPMGTWDDRSNRDECLSPIRNRIFVIDAPGFPNRLPAAHGNIWSLPQGRGFQTNVNATQIVMRSSFAEWVIAKSRDEGIPWTRISPMIFWHTINWLTRNASNQWVLDRTRSRIARGSLSASIINSPPR